MPIRRKAGPPRYRGPSAKFLLAEGFVPMHFAGGYAQEIDVPIRDGPAWYSEIQKGPVPGPWVPAWAEHTCEAIVRGRDRRRAVHSVRPVWRALRCAMADPDLQKQVESIYALSGAAGLRAFLIKTMRVRSAKPAKPGAAK